MLKRLIFVNLFLLFGFGITLLFSQNNIKMYFVGGAEKSTALNSLSKITFSENNLVLNLKNGDFEAIDLLTLQKIGFNVIDGLETVSKTDESMYVYPSPAIDRITLTNIPDNARQAIICRLDGSTVEKIQLLSISQIIDVSNIPSGFYFIKVNSSTIKFIKK